ncbi:site-specific integrase, partial [bacterium]
AEQTLAQAFDAYTAANVLRPNTAKHYAVVRDHVVRSGLGGRKLAKLVPSAQNEFTAWMVREGFAGSTVNVYADKLNAVLCFAAADGGLAFTPKAAKVDHRPEDVPAIALADVRALYEAAPERFAPAILLGAFCGLRASEAAAVTVADVDWTAGTVRVSKAVDARGQYDRTKTKRSVRTVPVPANVLAQLEPHRFRAPDANLAVNGRGRRLTTHSVGRAFGVAADDAALGDVTFHALRKFFATSLLARGVNPKAVAQWLGDSVTTMMARYALVQPTDADIARAAIAATFDAVAAA